MARRLILVSLISAVLAGSALAQTAGATDTTVDHSAECASWGLAPGTEEHKACVSALTDGNDAGLSQRRSDITQQRDQMRADMDRSAAEMRKQMDATMNAAQHPATGTPPNCVTTVNGSNTATICP